jgi:NUC153 domain
MASAHGSSDIKLLASADGGTQSTSVPTGQCRLSLTPSCSPSAAKLLSTPFPQAKTVRLGDVLTDSRFAAMFENRDFEVDLDADDYKQLHPNAGEHFYTKQLHPNAGAISSSICIPHCSSAAAECAPEQGLLIGLPATVRCIPRAPRLAWQERSVLLGRIVCQHSASNARKVRIAYGRQNS